MEGAHIDLRKNFSILYKQNNITTKTGRERREQKKKDDRTKRHANFDNRRVISPDCIEEKQEERVNKMEVLRMKHWENLKKWQEQRRLAAEQAKKKPVFKVGRVHHTNPLAELETIYKNVPAKKPTSTVASAPPTQHRMTTRSMVEKQSKQKAEPKSNVTMRRNKAPEAASVPPLKENKKQSKNNPKKVSKEQENSQTAKLASISESVGDSQQSPTLKTVENQVKKPSKTKKASKVQEISSNLPGEFDELSQVDMGTLKIASPTTVSPKTTKSRQSPALKAPENELKTPQKPLQSEETLKSNEISPNYPQEILKIDAPATDPPKNEVKTPSKSEEAPPAKETNSNSPVKSVFPVQCSPNSAANNFTKVLDNQIGDFQSKMSYWENEKSETLSEDSSSLICTAIGQANLLIANKFKKFRELIQCCRLQNGEKQVTPNDLDGYWALISQEVDNINKRFENLTLLKNNNWVEIVPEKVKKVSKKNKPKPVKKPTASSALREAIRAARMKKENTVVEVEAVNEKCLTPRKDHPQLLSVVKSSTKGRISSPGLVMMRVSQLCKSVEGRKHLEEGGRKSERLRVALFNDENDVNLANN